MSQQQDPSTTTHPIPTQQTPLSNAALPTPSGFTVDNLATRHLCAATYLDDDYRDAVLTRVYNETQHAVAPYSGVDAAVVITHAKRARMLNMIQAGILTGLILMLVLLSGDDFITVVVLLVLWQFILATVKLVKNTLAYIKGTDRNIRPLLGRALLLTFSSIIAFPLVIAGLTLVGSYLLPDSFSAFFQRAGLSTRTSSDLGAIAVTFLLFMAATVVTITVIRRHYIARLQNNPAGTPTINDLRLDRIRTGQHGNVVNYSNFTPFVGSGAEIRTWQFALPLHPRKSTHETAAPQQIPFTIDALTTHIRNDLTKLAVDTNTSCRLPNLQITDQVFVSGLDTVGPTHFAHELQASNLPTDITVIQQEPTSPVRHFLKCQIASWHAEVVTTVFVHAALQGETLYMELSSYLLPPTREEYHVLNDPRHIGGLAIALDIGRSLRALPRLIAKSPAVLVKRLVTGAKGALPQPKSLIAGSRDHGARTSVRELGTDLDVQHYFQWRDAVKYISILETQLLESTTEFLKDKVDISQLQTRAETIINAGVVNTGPVYTAAQGTNAKGQVGAQGPSATGSVTSS